MLKLCRLHRTTPTVNYQVTDVLIQESKDTLLLIQPHPCYPQPAALKLLLTLSAPLPPCTSSSLHIIIPAPPSPYSPLPAAGDLHYLQ